MKKPVKKAPAAAKKPKPKPKRQRARVSVNQIAAEPMQILGNANRPPEVGEVLKVLPDRLQSTVFAKTVKVDRITVEAGVTTIYATTF